MIRASIIIPLIFIRGPLLECITSWTTRQTFKRSEYEVLLVSPGLPEEKTAAARACLTEFDSLIVENTTNLYELYRAAANNAKGEIIVFCESHVQGMPTCLEEIITFLNNPDYVGVSCNSSSPADEKFFSKMEGMLFAEEQDVWSQPDHWRKVNERGFAIKRSTYFAFGGFDSRYEWFAGRAFSIALYEAGAKLGFAKNAVICHHNMTEMDDLLEGVRSFTFGETLYRLEKPSSLCNQYLEDSPEIHECQQLRSPIHQTFWRFHWFSLISNLKSNRPVNDDLLGLVQSLPAVLDPRLATWMVLLKAWIAAQIARVRMRFWLSFDEEKCFAAYREFWHRRLVRLYKLKNGLYLLDKLERERNRGKSTELVNQLESHSNSESPTYEIAELNESSLIGFYKAEVYDSRTFRWSRPRAAIAVKLSPRDYKLELELPQIRSLSNDLSLSVNFDGHQLKLRNLSPTIVECDLPREFIKERRTWHDLFLTCNELPDALKSPAETRALGIPLISITFKVNAESVHEQKFDQERYTVPRPEREICMTARTSADT